MDWALGALDGPARAAAESRRQSDAGFALLCNEWAERLSPLADEIAPLAPSAALWDRIDAAIGAEAALPVTAPAAAIRTPWWENLLLWRE